MKFLLKQERGILAIPLYYLARICETDGTAK